MLINEARAYVINQFPIADLDNNLYDIENFIQKDIINLGVWGEISFESGRVWSEDLQPSVHRRLHGWLFLSNWVSSLSQKPELIDVVYKIAENWSNRFLFLSEDDSLYRRAYHDEATSKRMQIAIRIHHYMGQLHEEPDERSKVMKRLLDYTAIKLASDSFYSGLNNHGMFQSLALRDYAVYADWLDGEQRLKFLNIANQRINKYFQSSFTLEGVHIEHSPTYHLMILRHVAEHLDFLKYLHDENNSLFLNQLIKKAENHSIHMILPNGYFIPISDTQQISISSDHHNVFDSTDFKFASTAGKQGTQPKELVLLEPRSGYFIQRNSWGSDKATVIAFIAAYNAIYHKHSDDLHIYLWSNGQEILSESGPFGYDPKEPFVKYGFSQWAHNNIVVDGSSLPRTDGRFDKVGIDRIVRSPGFWRAQGRNERFSDVSHERTLVTNDELTQFEVIDVLKSKTVHKYTLNWNFGPNVIIKIKNKEILGYVNNKHIFSMSIDCIGDINIVHYRGRGGSAPRGWRFPKMNNKVPASLVCVSFVGNDSLIKTQLTLHDVDSITIDGATGSAQGDTRSIVPTEKKVSAITVSVSDAEDEQPVRLRVVGNSLTFVTQDTDVKRAVIRLFSPSGLVDSKSGMVESIRWDDLMFGSYRVRIYPKSTKKRIVEPYSSSWFRI